MNISKIIFSISFFVLVSLVFPFDLVFAETIDMTSTRYENSWLIEFTNNGSIPVESFRLWSGDGASFQSVKTESGWFISQTSTGVLVFTSDSPLKQNDSVKFGIKANAPIDINWKALSVDSTELQTGITPHKSPDVFISDLPEPNPAILPNSSFKIIPETLRPGSTIRVVGNGFDSERSLDFFYGSKRLTPFLTSSTGYFIFTNNIPHDAPVGAVDFFIKDREGNVISHTVFIKEPIVRQVYEPIKFHVNELPLPIIQGNTFTISGNAEPGTPIVVTVFDPTGESSTAKTVDTEPNGEWYVSLIIPQTSELGDYVMEISDTNEIVREKFDVSFTKGIKIDAAKSWISIGDSFVFQGTGTPNENLRMFFVDSLGNEIHFIDTNVPPNGIVSVKLPTDESFVDGTYFLYAFQSGGSEVIPVGLNEYPRQLFSSKLDKVNYGYGDLVTIAIIDEPFTTIDLMLTDASGNVKMEDRVKLSTKGKMSYHINLKDMPSGLYDLAITKGSSSVVHSFSVGFPYTSFPIEGTLNKVSYEPEEMITLLGKTSPNTALDVVLVNPNGQIVKNIESFTDSKGSFVVDQLLVPLNAKNGEWFVQIDSGFRSDRIYFTVETSELFSIDSVDVEPSSIGTFVFIDGSNAVPSESFFINIENNNSQKWTVSVVPTKSGDFSVLWVVPDDAKHGDYTIRGINSNSEIVTYEFQILENVNP